MKTNNSFIVAIASIFSMLIAGGLFSETISANSNIMLLATIAAATIAVVIAIAGLAATRGMACKNLPKILVIFSWLGMLAVSIAITFVFYDAVVLASKNLLIAMSGVIGMGFLFGILLMQFIYVKFEDKYMEDANDEMLEMLTEHATDENLHVIVRNLTTNKDEWDLSYTDIKKIIKYLKTYERGEWIQQKSVSKMHAFLKLAQP